ncbi:MAG: 3'-5' exoribonuclease [Deferribacteraceae bacterium]|jgi:DNA polymerase-3 subunit epsilon|nr:3'-5' exoribonuclease [Deferribacteraceae bacterium]
MKHYRIGVSYVDLNMFHQGYPYVWGDGIARYMEQLKDIEIGDILVAGGTQRISFIGEVQERPAYLFPIDEVLYADCGVDKANAEALKAFAPIESSHNDVVCIKVKWFNIDCSGLCMPTQDRGAIRKLDSAGIAYIDNILHGRNAKITDAKPILNFTAMDFETATNNRNSVCQVGLVKVVNGVIIDEYCGLIQPPNNFIWQNFTAIHGIEPAQTTYAPPFAESWPRWKHFIEGQNLVAHNMQFDLDCLTTCLKHFMNEEHSFKTYCTMQTWSGAFASKSLAACCAALDIDLRNHHNALADAKACAELFIAAARSGRSLM